MTLSLFLRLHRLPLHIVLLDIMPRFVIFPLYFVPVYSPLQFLFPLLFFCRDLVLYLPTCIPRVHIY